jgi:uncharacterized membrane protein
VTDPAPADVPLPSTPTTRWYLPMLMIWASVLLSAWVYTNRVSEAAREAGGTRMLVTFAVVPAFALVILLVLRAIGRVKQTTSRHSDVLVLWITAFLFAVHASVLAVAIGMIDSLDRAIPAATGLLMFGMGPVLMALEPGSAMGIRTRATLDDPDVWLRTHRLAGKLFMLAGAVGLLGLLFEGPTLIAVAIAPSVLALVISMVYASRIAASAPGEHPSAAPVEEEDGGSP